MTSSLHYRIYITGASGSGVSSLGQALSAKTGLNHCDVDDYYWVPTALPFTIKRPVKDRLDMIAEQLRVQNGWILTGSFDGWGDNLIHDADLVIYVTCTHDIRMSRLLHRERQRYGDRINQDGDMYSTHKAFFDWAGQYDNPPETFNGRNRIRHEKWLKSQNIPVMRISSDYNSPEHMADNVLALLESKSK